MVGDISLKNINVLSAIKKKPYAVAKLQGSSKHPKLQATIEFFQIKEGVLVSAYVSGLPVNNDVCKKPIFAMHIHNGSSCSGNETDSFANAMTHYNPNNCPHPYHAGDMPPIFGVNGSGFLMFLTDRFSAEEIIGKTIIIHSNPDDFTTQPSGNSGEKMACGIIKKTSGLAKWLMK